MTFKIHISPVEKEFRPFFKRYNFQNQNIYLKDDKLYVYIEYVGNDLSRDKREFNKNPHVRKMNRELKEY